jgi:hypothetical protein
MGFLGVCCAGVFGAPSNQAPVSRHYVKRTSCGPLRSPRTRISTIVDCFRAGHCRIRSASRDGVGGAGYRRDICGFPGRENVCEVSRLLHRAVLAR